MTYENQKLLLLKFFRKVNNSKATCLRSLLILFIGVTILLIDKTAHDPLFQLRGDQRGDQRILLLTITPYDWESIGIKMGFKNPKLSYWEPKIWQHILEVLQEGYPYRIGISLTFTNGNPDLLDLIRLKHKNTYWFSYERGGKLHIQIFSVYQIKTLEFLTLIRTTIGSPENTIFPKIKLPS